MDAFFKGICQMGIFMICAQAIVHFRPDSSYEKYLRMLVSAMILVQVFLPIANLFTGKTRLGLEERIANMEQQVQDSLEKAGQAANTTNDLLDKMTLEEVKDRLEKQNKEQEEQQKYAQEELTKGQTKQQEYTQEELAKGQTKQQEYAQEELTKGQKAPQEYAQEEDLTQVQEDTQQKQAYDLENDGIILEEGIQATQAEKGRSETEGNSQIEIQIGKVKVEIGE